MSIRDQNPGEIVYTKWEADSLARAPKREDLAGLDRLQSVKECLLLAGANNGIGASGHLFTVISSQMRH